MSHTGQLRTLFNKIVNQPISASSLLALSNIVGHDILIKSLEILDSDIQLQQFSCSAFNHSVYRINQVLVLPSLMECFECGNGFCHHVVVCSLIKNNIVSVILPANAFRELINGDK